MGVIRISNDNIDELIEEIHRRDKLDTDFDIQYDVLFICIVVILLVRWSPGVGL